MDFIVIEFALYFYTEHALSSYGHCLCVCGAIPAIYHICDSHGSYGLVPTYVQIDCLYLFMMSEKP